MKLRLFAVLVSGLILLRPAAQAADAQHPNIIFILCDDMGYGDLGVFYQNSRPADKPSFQTPNIDSLAYQGLQLRDHYSASPVCAPARASLLLGQTQGHANVRDNQFDKAISAGPTLGSVLQAAGYYTGAVGKWGLGGSAEPYTAHPLDRGFNEFYGFMLHGDAHTHYPGNSGKIYDGYSRVTSGLDNAYSTDLFTARAKKFIVDHHTTAPEQPFFLYLAYTAPHVMLQVPSQAYPSGGGLTGGIQWPLNTTGGTQDSYIYPDYAAKAGWSPGMKRHASMIRRLDDGVGDLVQLLRDLHLDQNTIIVFTSDNGPSNEADGGAYTSDPRYFDSWGPLDGIKRDMWEGGIREPTIVWGPGFIPGGRTSTYVSAFWDWLPTLADFAGLAAPATSDGISLVPLLEDTGTPRARRHLYFEYYYDGSFGVDGGTDGLFARKDVTSRQQMQAVRIGDLKGVRYQITDANTPLRLYDVVNDPHEDHDLSADTQYRPLLQEMKDTLIQSHLTNTSAARPYDGTLVPAVKTPTIPGLAYAAYEGAWPWLPEFDTLSPVGTGQVSGLTASVAPSYENYGLLYTGYIYAPADGTYTFYAKGDAGVLLRVHDIVLIDDAAAPTGAEQSAQLPLKAGLHPIRLYYRHLTGTRALTFDWSGPSFSRRTVGSGDLRVDGIGTLTLNGDASQAKSGAGTSISVLDNDIPGSGDLRLVSAGPAEHGTVTVSGNQVVYTPNAGFLGVDHFSYTAADNISSATAQATLNVYADNGVLWLPFDETSGQTVNDASGQPRGVLQGFLSSPWTGGTQGGAIRFDSSAESVLINGFTPVTGAAPRSFAAWLKPDATQPGLAAWLSYGPNTTGNRISLRVDATNAYALRLEVQNGFVVGTTPLNDGKWHHVAVVIQDANNDGTTNVTESKLYVDGKVETISKKTAVAINTSASTTLTIGAANFASTYYYSGLIDDLRAYPYALTDAQVANLAKGSAAPLAQAWHRRYFGDTPVDWSAPDATNGLSRLTEYALGLSPNLGASRPETIALSPAGQPVFSYPQRRSSDVTYQVQTSTDLKTWTDGGAVSVSQTPSLNDPENFDNVSVTAPTGATTFFFRLQVQLPEL